MDSHPELHYFSTQVVILKRQKAQVVAVLYIRHDFICIWPETQQNYQTVKIWPFKQHIIKRDVTLHTWIKDHPNFVWLLGVVNTKTGAILAYLVGWEGSSWFFAKYFLHKINIMLSNFRFLRTLNERELGSRCWAGVWEIKIWVELPSYLLRLLWVLFA